MARNSNLSKAKDAKKDEFYTQLSDIEKELRHYKEHFRGKTVFCNCDDPYESNFFKYFAMNFNVLGLKKLISTCHITSPISQTQLSLFEEDCYDINKTKGVPAYKAVLTEIHDQNGDGAIDLKDVELTLQKKGVVTKMKGDGDFRSEESIELLKEADIVVTNPPFSLFREYMAQLVEYEKNFLIIGNMNAVTYKEIFPLVKNNMLWYGPSISSGDRKFYVPDDYPLNASSCGIDETGRRFIRVKGVRWFTNLDHEKRYEPLDLIEKYSPEKYPTYDNYDAINVDKTLDIPCNYYGVMGVPISFLDKYCPEQFEIIGMTASADTMDTPVQLGEEFMTVYRNQGGTGHFSANMYGVCYYDKSGKAKVPYGRVLIRRKDAPNHEN